MKDFVTEAQAAKMWCPHGLSICRVGGENLVVSNRVEKEIPRCLGSGCMFWRWSHQDNGPTADPTGFCGSAGLPKYI